MNSQQKIKEIIDTYVEKGIDLSKEEVGVVVEVHESIIIICGLASGKIGNIVNFFTTKGEIIQIDENFKKIILFNYTDIQPGLIVSLDDDQFMFPLGNELLGKIINPLGINLEINQEIIAPKHGIGKPENFSNRFILKDQLFTGIKMIDWINPLALGQKQAILGDKNTGKTLLCHSIQKTNPDFIYIYVSIGQAINKFQTLKKYMTPNSIFIVTHSSDSAYLKYKAPWVACTIGQYFQNQGHDVIVVIDTLDEYANAYRQIALNNNQYPGRDKYPGDLFFKLASLLEFASLNNKGSLSLFPIIQTYEDDITSYLCTNIIGITDGQIVFEKDLFHAQQFPAININLSVSRIGGIIHKDLKKYINGLKIKISKNKELKSILLQGKNEIFDLKKSIEFWENYE